MKESASERRQQVTGSSNTSASSDEMEINEMATAGSPAATAQPVTQPLAPASGTTAPQTPPTQSTHAKRTGRDRRRDSSWLELEACREHLRQTCPRSAEECRYAHSEPRILVKDGKVTCCYDFLKDRCYREKCRYFHPPSHIKERLVSAGKQFGAMMSNYHTVQPGGGTSNPYPTNNISSINSPSVPLMTSVIYGPDGRVMSAAPPGFFPGPPYSTERVEICPNLVQGRCTSPMCPLVHPEPHVRRNLDSTVTVCRDFLRGGCTREQCRYYHPLGSLYAHLEPSAMPAMMQQGIMVASPVMSVYPPMMYPIPPLSGPVTSLPSPVPAAISSTGMPLYSPVQVPMVLAPPPPGLVHNQSPPLSTITSTMPIPVLKEAAVPPPSIIMAPVPYHL